MSIAIVAAVFPIIFIGELPDKTMFASLIMATTGRPRSVWLGAAGAFLVHVVIATTIGVAIFHLFPHRAVEAVVAVLFALGAAYALWERAKEQAREAHEEEVVEHATEEGHRMIKTAFVVIFLAEWGDLTQILTANLAAHYHQPWSVFLGAATALVSVMAIGVVGGRALLRVLPLGVIRKVAGTILAGFTVYAVVQVA